MGRPWSGTRRARRAWASRRSAGPGTAAGCGGPGARGGCWGVWGRCRGGGWAGRGGGPGLAGGGRGPAPAGACRAAAEELAGLGVAVTVVDPRWTAPVDPALVKLAAMHRLVVAVEDTTTPGALGGRLAQALAAAGTDSCAATFALPGRFLP